MKLCPYPFSRMQTKAYQIGPEEKAAFYPCCPSWFKDEYSQIGFENNNEEIWNGKAAIELRKRMYQGDFSLCDRALCKMPLLTIEELENPNINFLETPISKDNLDAIKNKNPFMPAPPSSLHLVTDIRCNLKCPTCRPEIISNSESKDEADEEFKFVNSTSSHLEVVKMASSGEVFYSTVQRKILKTFSLEKFPKLKRIHIVTNGTLLNQKTYNDLKPGSEFIKDISVSIDAGTKETYEKIRGPYWDQLLENLTFISELRKNNSIEYFTLNFTLIESNFRDIPELITLGKKLNVDRILLQRYLYYPSQGFNRFEQTMQAIQYQSHPKHHELIALLNKYKDEPILHSLLDIPGFESKIEDQFQIKQAQALQILSEKNLENKDLLTSFKNIKESLNLYPTDLARYTLSKIYFEFAKEEILKGEFEKSISNLAFSLEYDVFCNQKNNSHASWKLKEIMFEFEKNKDFKNVLRMMDIIRHFNFQDENVLFSSGIAHLSFKQFVFAKACFEESLLLNPNHQSSKNELNKINNLNNS